MVEILKQFADPAQDSQVVFRALLDAMARPGSVVTLPSGLAAPKPLDPATTALLLTLIDGDTSVWLDAAASAVAPYLAFHCGCPVTADPAEADFAVICDLAAMPSFSAFKAGSEDYPDRSATLILQLPALAGGTPHVISGPGLKTRAEFAVDGLPPSFIQGLRDNHALFPRGLDFIFTSGQSLCALPRSTRVEG